MHASLDLLLQRLQRSAVYVHRSGAAGELLRGLHQIDELLQVKP